ncbi:hypothetical protein ACFPAG_03225 [Vogesella sp. GCM10023246]|uniref:Uncharacterized protein n=1 Tax=Vogesella oryzagri TaxID=3160864 RepID=A0ABV1M1X0_9NEIS
MKRKGLSGLDARDLINHSVSFADRMCVLVKCMSVADAADMSVMLDLARDQVESYGQIFDDYQQKVA